MACVARFFDFNNDNTPNWEQSITNVKSYLTDQELMGSVVPLSNYTDTVGLLYMIKEHNAISFMFYTFDNDEKNVARHYFYICIDQLKSDTLPQIERLRCNSLFPTSGELYFNIENRWGFRWSSTTDSWTCHGPMEIFTIYNLHQVRFPYQGYNREVTGKDFIWTVPCITRVVEDVIHQLHRLINATVTNTDTATSGTTATSVATTTNDNYCSIM